VLCECVGGPEQLEGRRNARLALHHEHTTPQCCSVRLTLPLTLHQAHTPQCYRNPNPNTNPNPASSTHHSTVLQCFPQEFRRTPMRHTWDVHYASGVITGIYLRVVYGGGVPVGTRPSQFITLRVLMRPNSIHTLQIQMKHWKVLACCGLTTVTDQSDAQC
jgi:hypothetical protein